MVHPVPAGGIGRSAIFPVSRHPAALFPGIAACGQPDPSPRRGELDGVGQEVVEDLGQLAFIRPDHLRQSVRSADTFNPHSRILCPKVERLLSKSDFRRISDRCKFHLADLHLAEVEKVVDERQQVRPAGADVADRFPLPVVQGPEAFIPQQLGKADDRIERGAEFMGDIGEEFRLEAVGLPRLDCGQLKLPVLAIELVPVAFEKAGGVGCDEGHDEQENRRHREDRQLFRPGDIVVGVDLHGGQNPQVFQRQHDAEGEAAQSGVDEWQDLGSHDADVGDQRRIDGQQKGGFDAPEGIDDGGVADNFQEVDEDAEAIGRLPVRDPFENPERGRVHQDEIGNGEGIADKILETDEVEQISGQTAEPHDEAGRGSDDRAP